MSRYAGIRHRHGVRHQQHFGGHRTRRPIEPGPSHTRIFQVHNIHQVVQGDVSVRTSQSGQKRRGKPGKGDDGVVAKSGEQQVEPDHVGLQLTNCAGDVGAAAEVTERPAANDRELLEFWLRRVQAVRKHGQANERVLLQLTRNVKTVFAQTSSARRKCTDKTDLHGPASTPQPGFDVKFALDVAAEKINAYNAECRPSAGLGFKRRAAAVPGGMRPEERGRHRRSERQ